MARGSNRKAITNGGLDPLLAAEVTFSGLNGYVPRQKLNLLQLATGCVAEASATPAQIVRRQRRDASDPGVLPYNVPDHLFRHAGPHTVPAFVTRRKILPLVIAAACVHRSNRELTQSGTGPSECNQPCHEDLQSPNALRAAEHLASQGILPRGDASHMRVVRPTKHDLACL